jgi:hypothetical protein
MSDSYARNILILFFFFSILYLCSHNKKQRNVLLKFRTDRQRYCMFNITFKHVVPRQRQTLLINYKSTKTRRIKISNKNNSHD